MAMLQLINKDVLNKIKEELERYEVKLGDFLTKGTTSIIFLGKYRGKDVVVKVSRDDSPRKNLKKEAEILRHLRGREITGDLILYTTVGGREILVREYVPGEPVLLVTPSKKHILKIAGKTFVLDKLGIDHGQIQGGKHILLTSNDVYIIDFEKGSLTRKTRNLTSALSMLFIGNNSISKRVREKFDIDEEFIRELKLRLREYKEKKEIRGLFDLLSIL